MAERLPDIMVIRDSREQKGWDFEPENKEAGRVRILGTEITALDFGDYTIKGGEHLVRIERKFGFAELFGNMMPKEHKERFEREMDKMREIPFKYILVESNVSSDVLNLGVPQIFRGPPVGGLVKWLLDIQMEFGVTPLFVGDCGKRVARYIFETVARRYPNVVGQSNREGTESKPGQPLRLSRRRPIVA